MVSQSRSVVIDITFLPRVLPRRAFFRGPRARIDRCFHRPPNFHTDTSRSASSAASAFPQATATSATTLLRCCCPRSLVSHARRSIWTCAVVVASVCLTRRLVPMQLCLVLSTSPHTAGTPGLPCSAHARVQQRRAVQLRLDGAALLTSCDSAQRSAAASVSTVPVPVSVSVSVSVSRPFLAKSGSPG